MWCVCIYIYIYVCVLYILYICIIYIIYIYYMQPVAGKRTIQLCVSNRVSMFPT